MKQVIKRNLRPILRYYVAKSKQKKQIHNYKSPESFYSHLIRHEINAKSSNALDEQPIFIFSAGWRSGSTLLQRLLSSSSELLMWGEPYDKSCLIQKLASSFLPFDEYWPPQSYFIKNRDIGNISNLWVANLYPDYEDLYIAHKKFILNLFSDTAVRYGCSRWGVKEVRFGMNEALYLSLLFPKAKFLFLKRDLLSAYISYAGFSQQDWYSEWPHKTAFSAYSFAKHRSRLIKEFKKVSDLVGGMVIDYEDLTSGTFDFQKLESYCDLKINKNILEKRVGSGAKGGKQFTPSFYEKLLLNIGDF
jgi:hypothetical protein